MRNLIGIVKNLSHQFNRVLPSRSSVQDGNCGQGQANLFYRRTLFYRALEKRLQTIRKIGKILAQTSTKTALATPVLKLDIV